MQKLRLLKREPQFVLAIVLLPVMLYVGNPAIALLVAAGISLMFNRAEIPHSGNIGKIALQSAIILLGLKLNASELLDIGANYSLLVTAYVVVTLCAGLLLGVLIRAEKKSSQLIASATAICGGTAIASLSPIINAEAEQTGVALTLIFLLNAIALFTFPAIGEYLSLTQEQFGVWVALAIHDTSSVVATASIYGEEAARIATTVKLGRTLWLIPLLIGFSILQHTKSGKIQLPVFIGLFVIAACLGSFVTLPSLVIDSASIASKLLLVVALYCIGSEITRRTLKSLRGTVLLHGVLLWALVVPSTLILVLA